MNARTLVITAGAVVALAAPAVANAKAAPGSVPAKHALKKHAAKPAFKRQGQSRQIYIYSPGPTNPISVLTEQQLEAQYNADLVAHGLDPVAFPDSTPAPTSSDSTSSGSTSSDVPPASPDTTNATFTAAAATTLGMSSGVDPTTMASWDC